MAEPPRRGLRAARRSGLTSPDPSAPARPDGHPTSDPAQEPGQAAEKAGGGTPAAEFTWENSSCRNQTRNGLPKSAGGSRLRWWARWASYLSKGARGFHSRQASARSAQRNRGLRRRRRTGCPCQSLASIQSTGRVVLAGGHADVPEILPTFDVFVLPSRYEGLPTAVVEAIVYGIPVVATAVNAVSDVVIPGETGLLVPPLREQSGAALILSEAGTPSFAGHWTRTAAAGPAAAGRPRRKCAEALSCPNHGVSENRPLPVSPGCTPRRIIWLWGDHLLRWWTAWHPRPKPISRGRRKPKIRVVTVLLSRNRLTVSVGDDDEGTETKRWASRL